MSIPMDADENLGPVKGQRAEGPRYPSLGRSPRNPAPPDLAG
jgi:hypothetical protein